MQLKKSNHHSQRFSTELNSVIEIELNMKIGFATKLMIEYCKQFIAFGLIENVCGVKQLGILFRFCDSRE